MKMFCPTRTFFPLQLALCMLIALSLGSVAHAQSLKIEAKLVWGTDDPQSPNPHHRPLEATLTKRLKDSPYRWKHYFEENHQIIEIPEGQTKSKIVMSPNCSLDIKNLGGDCVEVRLHGNGKLVSRHNESLKGNGLLVLGGQAPNSTCWLVTIRKAVSRSVPVLRSAAAPGTASAK